MFGTYFVLGDHHGLAILGVFHHRFGVLRRIAGGRKQLFQLHEPVAERRTRWVGTIPIVDDVSMIFQLLDRSLERTAQDPRDESRRIFFPKPGLFLRRKLVIITVQRRLKLGDEVHFFRLTVESGWSGRRARHSCGKPQRSFAVGLFVDGHELRPAHRLKLFRHTVMVYAHNGPVDIE